MVSLLEMMVTTAMSAFFASLAAVAVTAWLDRKARLRAAKTTILSAFQRHQERLWAYANAYQSAALLDMGHAQTNAGQRAPSKPPVEILAAEVRSVRHVFREEARLALARLHGEIMEAEADRSDPALLADWSAESTKLQRLAERVAGWNMRSADFPELGERFSAYAARVARNCPGGRRSRPLSIRPGARAWPSQFGPGLLTRFGAARG